jgi:hypothetical protein
MSEPEQLLSAALLRRGSFAGGEWAWRPSDIPDVIEGAREAGLVSLGGQLQFRLPAGTCECYWVDVSPSLDSKLPWTEQVSRSAANSLADFRVLCSKFDFVAEGRKAFAEYFDEFEARGGDLNDAMYFVWYVATEESLADLERRFRLAR